MSSTPVIVHTPVVGKIASEKESEPHYTPNTYFLIFPMIGIIGFLLIALGFYRAHKDLKHEQYKRRV